MLPRIWCWAGVRFYILGFRVYGLGFGGQGFESSGGSGLWIHGVCSLHVGFGSGRSRLRLVHYMRGLRYLAHKKQPPVEPYSRPMPKALWWC